jgi:hypothetical protein
VSGENPGDEGCDIQRIKGRNLENSRERISMRATGSAYK